MKHSTSLVCLTLGLVATAVAAACGSSGDGSTFPGSAHDGGPDDDGSSVSLRPDGGGGGSGSISDPTTFVVTPTPDTLTAVIGGTPPTQQLQATDNGKPVNASFRILDRGELGSVGLTSGLFTAAGNLGGVVSVVADLDGYTSQPALITVKLQGTENGDPAAADAGAGGAGGYGGVGGSGTGGPVSPAVQAVLDSANPGSDGSAWLYPYDQTVFPRAILAPLLQWQPGTAKDYDGIKIQLTEGNYTFTGYFAKPAAATVFQNHPIPQDVWTTLYSSYTSATGGESVTVNVTLSSGGKAYALPPRTWTIAGGALQGTVYYNSYNTQLVTNSDFFVAVNGKRVRIGAATLAIRADSTAPTVAAGVSSGAADGSDCTVAGKTANDNGSGCNATGCRVCHSVAAKGGSLITQQGELTPYTANTDYNTSKLVTLSATSATEATFGTDNGQFTFPALSPDGTLVFTNGQYGTSSLFKTSNLTTPASAGSTGLASNLGAWNPTFSPDGAHVAFNYWTGTGADQKSLAEVNYDAAGNAFTAPKVLFTPGAGVVTWPSYLPASNAIVFANQTADLSDFGQTWRNSQASLWWYDETSGKAAALANLNGVSLPTSASHPNDAILNYEPTVNPVASGGYAWVVFTSRRLYGNVATLDPYDSDPRNDGGLSLTSPTPKKLWVAAVDLNAPGGTDPSHPAFYLPAQELLAGNSRGFWVVDPCKADGSSCSTGDQCCGGYCQAGGDSGALVCGSTKPTCAADYDKCSVTADCCDAPSGTACIGGVCTVQSPR
jgi:hypothetical protein